MLETPFGDLAETSSPSLPPVTPVLVQGVLTVYCGVVGDPEDPGLGDGLARTLLRDRAEWFARRFGHLDGSAMVLTGSVAPGEVWLATDARNGREVVSD